MRVRPFVCVLCVAAIGVVPPRAGAQSTVEPPGSRQPVGLTRPRIPPLPEAQWADAHRQLASKFSRGGRLDNGFRTLLHLPAVAEALAPYTIYLSEDSTLSLRHRALLILRTAWVCGSRPLWSAYAPLARTAGMTPDEIRRIAEGPDAPGWNGFEATLLRLVDQLYRNSAVNDATWRELSASYSVLNLMDAVETANHFTVLSMMYNTFGVQPDEGAADWFPADVPYRVAVPVREPPLTVARVEPVPGDSIAVTRTLQRHPTLVAARTPRTTFINRVSKLPPRYREMLILRIGWNCRSEYEWAQHVGSVGRAREHGLEPVRIAEGADAPGWDPLERAILRAVDELYRDTMISDGTWSALAERFDTGLLMSAVMTASSYRATSMVLNALGVQLEPGDERFPQLPAAR